MVQDIFSLLFVHGEGVVFFIGPTFEMGREEERTVGLSFKANSHNTNTHPQTLNYQIK